MSGQTFTTLLYGSIVNQILDDVQDPVKTTEILNSFGIQIGSKLVDDYVSRFPTQCQNFKQVSDGVLGAICYFLDIKRENISLQQADDVQFTIQISNNPLEQFVKVPTDQQGLIYLQILPGAVIGALKQLQYEVDASYKDSILKVKLISKIQANFGQQ